MVNIVRIFNDSNVRPLPKKKIEKVVNSALKAEGADRAEIDVIFIDDVRIRELNKKFLNHNYVTDVISFQYGEGKLEGEVYIGVGRAKVQALFYKVSTTKELQRLAVHGTLHLIGYDDGTEEQRELMSKLETRYIED